MFGCADVFLGLIRDVKVDPHEDIFEALSRVVHNAELESLLVLEGFGQSAAESIRGQHLLTAELELCKNALQSAEDARVLHALMCGKLPETSSEDIQMPENLESAVQKAAVLSRLVD